MNDIIKIETQLLPIAKSAKKWANTVQTQNSNTDSSASIGDWLVLLKNAAKQLQPVVANNVELSSLLSEEHLQSLAVKLFKEIPKAQAQYLIKNPKKTSAATIATVALVAEMIIAIATLSGTSGYAIIPIILGMISALISHVPVILNVLYGQFETLLTTLNKPKIENDHNSSISTKDALSKSQEIFKLLGFDISKIPSKENLKMMINTLAEQNGITAKIKNILTGLLTIISSNNGNKSPEPESPKEETPSISCRV